jgi:hypothetical protein
MRGDATYGIANPSKNEYRRRAAPTCNKRWLWRDRRVEVEDIMAASLGADPGHGW